MIAIDEKFDLPTGVDPEHWRTAKNVTVVRYESIALPTVLSINSSPEQLVPRTARTQDNLYPGQVLSKTTCTFLVGQIGTSKKLLTCCFDNHFLKHYFSANLYTPVQK